MYGIVQTEKMLIQIVYVNVFRKHITDLDTRRVLNCIAFIGCKLFALLEEPTWATSCKAIILFLYQFRPSRRAERIRVELGKGVHICFQHASAYSYEKLFSYYSDDTAENTTKISLSRVGFQLVSLGFFISNDVKQTI